MSVDYEINQCCVSHSCLCGGSFSEDVKIQNYFVFQCQEKGVPQYQARPAASIASVSTSSAGAITSRGGDTSSSDTQYLRGPTASAYGTFDGPHEFVKINGYRGLYDPFFVPFHETLRNIFSGGRRFGRNTTWIV